jgi:deoxyribodipyrimidine photo-lyase
LSYEVKLDNNQRMKKKNAGSTPTKLAPRADERPAVAIFWFRRDLRLEDNVGLAAALKGELPVVPLFIFDTAILSRLEEKADKRVELIRDALESLAKQIAESGGGLAVEHGTAAEAWARITARFDVRMAFANHDYEPYAKDRDAKVAKLLEKNGADLVTFKDQVIFEKLEVEKGAGGPYTVFTPYSRKWLSQLTPVDLKAHEGPRENFLNWKGDIVPTLATLGFEKCNGVLEALIASQPKITTPWVNAYEDERNFPALDSTSRLGPSLRFGLVSVRHAVKLAQHGRDTWLKELIWREFFMQILWNFPHVVSGPFRPEYGKIQWRNDKAEFRKWSEGKTGYDLVDAGMRELNATGFMHNRVRMVAASFLVKHLLIDWKWGEDYFARKLLDFDLASNNGNWQWVAGSGCDAAPYFRVFNPETQAKKFDREGEYIRTWVPEVISEPGQLNRRLEPMVSHVEARVRVLRAYRAGLGR